MEQGNGRPDPGTAAGGDWHALRAAEALSALGSDGEGGLTAGEVAARRARHGDNVLPAAGRRMWAAIVLQQFKSPLIYILLAAGLLAAIMGEVGDALVIAVVVLLNAVIGGIQEGRAERSLASLRKLAGHRAHVVRDGEERVVEAREIVPGDLLQLAAGDAIAADARLVEGVALEVAEAALTGESVSVAKDVAAVPAATPLPDRRNMVFAGTHVTAGRGRAVVVATATATEIGRIAALAAGAPRPRTPLERRVQGFGRSIVVVALVLTAVLFAAGLVRGLPFREILMVAISQLVGVIPEGLPVAMTVALAVGVQRMARRRAIVRRLSAVETLGSTTVICSDKTGTLTRNEMSVTALHLPGRPEVEVTGEGYAPEGRFLEGGRELDPAADPALRALLEAVALCNDARLVGPGDEGGDWTAEGDPTEAALLALAARGGIEPGELHARFPRAAEIPFGPVAKMMATQHDAAGRRRVVLKGAPEAVLEMCATVGESPASTPLDEAGRAALRVATERMAERALRVLAVAVVDDAAIDGRLGFAPFRGRASLLGLVGEIDPPRAEAAAAVAACRSAGIRPVMVTGDHRATGLAVARVLDIARPGDRAVDGPELDRMGDEELVRDLDRISVYARVLPAQKLRIIEAFRARGEVVAMTGDGVNDAPALVRADVGVAMGITGTDVAREASEIVVTDDNFSTIVAAVEEGRIVHRNLEKVILYLFATSLSEVALLLTALFLGYPLPVAAVQILWNNLVTEGTVAISLIMEPAEGDEMRRRPRPRGEPLVTRGMLWRMAFMTPAMTVSALTWFVGRLAAGVSFPQVQTETFCILSVCQWFNVLNCRSATRSAFDRSVFRNGWLIAGLVAGNLLQAAVVFLPPLNRIFHTVPIGVSEFIWIGAMSSLVLWVEELRKLVVRRRQIAFAPA